jgi:hypothetical protein
VPARPADEAQPKLDGDDASRATPFSLFEDPLVYPFDDVADTR